MKTFWVYITSNLDGKLYVGVTNDLERRLGEHEEGETPSYSSRYHLTRLVYYEEFDSIREAIEREKQTKRWRREKKVALIRSLNPGWRDLVGETP